MDPFPPMSWGASPPDQDIITGFAYLPSSQKALIKDLVLIFGFCVLPTYLYHSLFRIWATSRTKYVRTYSDASATKARFSPTAMLSLRKLWRHARFLTPGTSSPLCLSHFKTDPFCQRVYKRNGVRTYVFIDWSFDAMKDGLIVWLL